MEAVPNKSSNFRGRRPRNRKFAAPPPRVGKMKQEGDKMSRAGIDCVAKGGSKFKGRRPRNRKVAVAPQPSENNDQADCGKHGKDSTRRTKHEKKQKPHTPRKPKNRRSPCCPKGLSEIGEEESARYIALDCEMVGVGDGNKSAVARVCLLDWGGDTIFDTFVRVAEPVTDYRTFVSGIREEHLSSDDAMDLDSCRSTVCSLIEGKVLIGHALKNDLRALDIRHPWHDVRDTAKYEPFMKTRFNDGVLWPRKLKDLALEVLGQTIQPAGMEHSPVEDAKAALELYKSVRNKWEKVMEYKIKKTREIESQKEAAREAEMRHFVPALPSQ